MAQMPPEAQLAQWWREGTYRNVATTRGQALQVLYPGRPSSGPGPDFQDALLITEEGELVRGDVEVHVRQREWQDHGHHLDSRYNRVVLHLCLHGGRNGTWLENGTQAQEVLLLSPLSSPSRLSSAPRAFTSVQSLAPLCSRGKQATAGPIERLRALPLREMERALDEAGEHRFLDRATAMLERQRRGDAQAELFAGLMEALGYSRNRGPMLLLARGVPLGQMKALIGPIPNRLALEALLLGASGLLPHQRGLSLPGWEERSRTDALAEMWRSMGEPVVVDAGVWSFSGLRPQNHPVRRLVGASYLIAAHWHSGLVEDMEAVLKEGSPRETERALKVEGTEFWARHLDFHRPVTRAPALVGRSRARDMVINILLPFFFARAHLLGDGEMGQRIRSLYRTFPPGQDNEITREVKGLLTASKASQPVINSARRQQGLIHIYQVLQGRAR